MRKSRRCDQAITATATAHEPVRISWLDALAVVVELRDSRSGPVVRKGAAVAAGYVG